LVIITNLETFLNSIFRGSDPSVGTKIEEDKKGMEDAW